MKKLKRSERGKAWGYKGFHGGGLSMRQGERPKVVRWRKLPMGAWGPVHIPSWGLLMNQMFPMYENRPGKYRRYNKFSERIYLT